MSARINTGDKKFDGQVLKHIAKGTSIPKAAAAMGINGSTMADAFYRLEPVADPSLKITGNKQQVAKAIVRLRNAGMRWERLAHRSGLSYKAVKEVFTATSGVAADSTYTGRGRHYERVTAKKVMRRSPNTRKSNKKVTA